MEDEHAFVKRVMEDAGKEAETARDLGSEIHDEIAFRLQNPGAVKRPNLTEFITPVMVYLEDYEILWTEKVLIGEGYAGTADIGARKVKQDVIFDVKTCKDLPKGPWTEHQLQLSAYMKAENTSAQVANIYVSKTVPGNMVVYFHDNPHRTFQDGFAPLLKVWQWANNYLML